MRVFVGLAVALAGCDPFGLGAPWHRDTLLSSGADRVEIEYREQSMSLDHVYSYRIGFSHDGGHTSTRVLEGQDESVTRRARGYRLPSGQLGAIEFTKACVEAAPKVVVCKDYYEGAPVDAALFGVLFEVARDRTLEAVVRARAALTLARSRAPGAGAVLASMLAEPTDWHDQKAPLQAALAELPREPVPSRR
jgi:hypothetical protein